MSDVNNVTTSTGAITSTTTAPDGGVATTTIPTTTATSTTPLTTSTTTTPIAAPTTTTATEAPVTITSTAPTLAPTTQIVTSIVSVTPTNANTASLSTVITTVVTTPSPSTTLTTTSSTPVSSTSAAANGSNGSSNSQGLSSGATIAIAVVIPIIVVAGLVALGLFCFKKRKQRKTESDERKQEMEDYSFNPNHDPTLPAVAAYSEADDQSGYRGWGGGGTARQPSGTLSSSVANRSDGGGYQAPSSPGRTDHSGDAIVAGAALPGHSRKTTMDSDTMGQYGAMPVRHTSNGGREGGMQRGPSNASSTYSMGDRGRNSADAPIPVNGEFYTDYYQAGPYDNQYSGQQEAVIRDNPARRNTRIERAPTMPQQGSSGIAQNF